MFEAKLEYASLLKKIIDAIKETASDAPLDIKDDGIILRAMDGSHVALVSLRLGVGLFDVYRCDRNICIGLSMKNMATALKCAGSEDSCLIRHDENEGESVTLTFNDKKSQRNQEITIKLLDIEQEHLDIPDQKYSSIIEMSSTDFQKLISDLTSFGETITIQTQENQVKFETRSSENGGNVVTYRSDVKVCDDMSEDEEDEKPKKMKKKKEKEGISITVLEPVKQSFSIKMLGQFTKASKVSDRVRLCFLDRTPMVVEYPILEDGSLKFYLAPKIDEIDDD